MEQIFNAFVSDRSALLSTEIAIPYDSAVRSLPNCNGLCETVIRLSTRLGLIEVFLNHASQVGKQAVALPPV